MPKSNLSNFPSAGHFFIGLLIMKAKLSKNYLNKLIYSSLKTGYTDYLSSSNPRVNTNYEVTIKEEGYFQNFDLVIALRQKFSVGSNRPRNNHFWICQTRA
jgi:hypothetical protein